MLLTVIVWQYTVVECGIGKAVYCVVQRVMCGCARQCTRIVNIHHAMCGCTGHNVFEPGYVL